MLITGDVTTSNPLPDNLTQPPNWPSGSYGTVAARRYLNSMVAGEHDLADVVSVRFVDQDTFAAGTDSPESVSKGYGDDLFGFTYASVVGTNQIRGDQARDWLSLKDIEHQHGVGGTEADFRRVMAEQRLVGEYDDSSDLADTYQLLKQTAKQFFKALDVNGDNRVNVGEYAAWPRFIDGVKQYAQSFPPYAEQVDEFDAALDEQAVLEGNAGDDAEGHNRMALDGVMSYREQNLANGLVQLASQIPNGIKQLLRPVQQLNLPEHYQAWVKA